LISDSAERASDELMVPIGGGNPYYHCKHCGVTNVQLNSGSHSRSHAKWCEYWNQWTLPNGLGSQLVAEVERLRAAIQRWGIDATGVEIATGEYRRQLHAALESE
jgi:hypothetical protein